MPAAVADLFMVQVQPQCYHSCSLFTRLQVWILACVLLTWLVLHGLSRCVDKDTAVLT